MVAGGPHTRPVAHAHAADAEQRLLVALAERLEDLELVNARDGHLVERDDGGDLSAIDELLGRKLRHHRLEAFAKGVEHAVLAGHAHGACVAAKALPKGVLCEIEAIADLSEE